MQGDLPSIGMAEHEPRQIGEVMRSPVADREQVFGQLVIAADHAPAAVAAAVAAIIDGDHVELEPRAERFGDAVVGAAVLAETVRHDHNPSRRPPAPPAPAQQDPVGGTNLDLALARLCRRHFVPRDHRSLRRSTGPPSPAASSTSIIEHHDGAEINFPVQPGPRQVQVQWRSEVIDTSSAGKPSRSRTPRISSRVSDACSDASKSALASGVSPAAYWSARRVISWSRPGPRQVPDHESASRRDQAGHRPESRLGVRDVVNDRVRDDCFETALAEIIDERLRISVAATDPVREPRGGDVDRRAGEHRLGQVQRQDASPDVGMGQCNRNPRRAGSDVENLAPPTGPVMTEKIGDEPGVDRRNDPWRRTGARPRRFPSPRARACAGSSGRAPSWSRMKDEWMSRSRSWIRSPAVLIAVGFIHPYFRYRKRLYRSTRPSMPPRSGKRQTLSRVGRPLRDRLGVW